MMKAITGIGEEKEEKLGPGGRELKKKKKS